MYTHSCNPFVTGRQSYEEHLDNLNDEFAINIDTVVTSISKNALSSPIVAKIANNIMDHKLCIEHEHNSTFELLKSPTVNTKTEMSPFRVSFEDTDNEQHEAIEPLTSLQPLTGCLIFVDVRAENENRSKAISRELERLGATIADKITRNLTHVVFKNGKNATLSQIKKYSNIHVVSVLWVDSCKTTSSRMSENLFPAQLPDTFDSPMPVFARARRVKSLQPKTFEEDLHNSAKKQERKKRRIKRQNIDTSIDPIICLDSQEYIKSSDLYKLVATPRAIPDTPWMLKYVNGEDEENTSQFDSSNKNDSKLQELSEDIQCRLNFGNSVDIEEHFEKSPCKKGQLDDSLVNSKDVILRTPKRKVGFKNLSLCRRSSRSSTDIPVVIDDQPKESISKKSPVIHRKPGECVLQKPSTNCLTSGRKSGGLDEGEFIIPKPVKEFKPVTTDVNLCEENQFNLHESPSKIAKNSVDQIVRSSRLSNKFFNTNTKLNNNYATKVDFDKNHVGANQKDYRLEKCMSNSPENIMTVEEVVKNSHQNVLTVEEVPKKKKRLLSKTKFNLPQDQLISPVLKSSSNENYKDKDSHTNGPKWKVRNNKNKSFDVYAAISSVENSKKETSAKENSVSKLKMKKGDESETSKRQVLNYVACKKTFDSAKGEGKCESNEPHLLQKKLVDSESISSGSVMFAQLCNPPMNHNRFHEVLATNSVVNSQTEIVYKEQTASSPTNRRRSSQILATSRRSSGVDFKVSRAFRSFNLSKDRAKVNIKNMNQNITQRGHNVSSVKNENEVLVYRSQERQSYSEFKLPVVNDKVDDKVETIPSVLKTSHVETKKNNVKSISEPPDEDDSGISDSEELNTDRDSSKLRVVTNSQLTETDTSIIASTSISKETDKRHCKVNCGEVKRRAGTQLANKPMTEKIIKKTIKDCSLSTTRNSASKISLVMTSLHYGEQEYVKTMSKELGGFVIRKNVSSDTTHLIAGGPRRTLNILHAVIRGCWILNSKWVADSIENGDWLDEADYEMYEEFPMARVSRINRTRNGKYNHTKLFSRLQPVYLSEVTSPSHEDMMKLITLCGGKLTTSLRKAGVGVGVIKTRRKDLRIVSEKWILDSISNCHIMPTGPYEIKLTDHREQSPTY